MGIAKDNTEKLGLSAFTCKARRFLKPAESESPRGDRSFLQTKASQIGRLCLYREQLFWVGAGAAAAGAGVGGALLVLLAVVLLGGFGRALVTARGLSR